MQAGSPEALAYTALVEETAAAFHAAIPGSQVCDLIRKERGKVWFPLLFHSAL